MQTKTIAVLIAAVIVAVAGTYWYAQHADQFEELTTPLPSDFVSLRPQVDALSTQELSADERSGILYMREEEKLARDVYTTLGEKWGLPIFSNIAQSEQTHTEAVWDLIEKYNLTDPVTDDSVGAFTNEPFGNLYAELTTQGERSAKEALLVGALIEELDIKDISERIAQTDNADIKLVYENLMRGSRNHLRSFVSQLSRYGATYTPQYISQAEYESIINSPRETGR